MALTQITGGDGIKDGSIKEADLNIDNSPQNDYVLTAKSSACLLYTSPSPRDPT